MKLKKVPFDFYLYVAFAAIMTALCGAGALFTEKDGQRVVFFVLTAGFTVVMVNYIVIVVKIARGKLEYD